MNIFWSPCFTSYNILDLKKDDYLYMIKIIDDSMQFINFTKSMINSICWNHFEIIEVCGIETEKLLQGVVLFKNVNLLFVSTIHQCYVCESFRLWKHMIFPFKIEEKLPRKCNFTTHLDLNNDFSFRIFSLCLYNYSFQCLEIGRHWPIQKLNQI